MIQLVLNPFFVFASHGEWFHRDVCACDASVGNIHHPGGGRIWFLNVSGIWNGKFVYLGNWGQIGKLDIVVGTSTAV